MSQSLSIYIYIYIYTPHLQQNSILTAQNIRLQSEINSIMETIDGVSRTVMRVKYVINQFKLR